MTKKILIIHPSLGTGGAEKIIAFLANTLSKDYKVRLLLMKNIDKTLPIDHNVEILVEENYSEKPIISKDIFGGIRALRSMSITIEENYLLFQPDLVICFDLRILLATYLALKKSVKKIVFSERADPYENRKYWQFILKHIYRKIGYIVFQTKGAQEFYKASIERKSMIIANPALTRMLKDETIAIDSRENYIFTAGRFQHRKGFDVLIKAFAKCADLDQSTELRIYGNGEEEHNLKNLIKTLKLENRVKLLPPEVGIIEKNRNARMFVLPSRSEGIPNILIEAMMSGIPCVAADCSPGGAKLLTDNGRYALLANYNDHISLAEQMSYALNHKEEMECLAKAAQENIKRFDSEKIAEEWRNVIKKQIEKKE